MTSSNTPSYPEYKFVPTTVVANGETLAKQYQDAAGNIVTDISLSQDSVDRKKKLNELLKEYENTVNIFSPELNAQIESIANAKKQNALNDFNSMYEPAVTNAREDYFSRLGTLDSTAYLDRVNSMEKTRQQAYVDIANDYLANIDELKNNELSRRYSYLNYLQNGLNALNTQNNNYLGTIHSLSSSYTDSYNNYLSNLYGTQSRANDNNIFSNLFNSAGGVIGSIASFF